MSKPPSLLDPSFRYSPSHATDIRRTFERIRREREQARDNVRPLLPARNKELNHA